MVSQGYWQACSSQLQCDRGYGLLVIPTIEHAALIILGVQVVEWIGSKKLDITCCLPSAQSDYDFP